MAISGSFCLTGKGNDRTPWIPSTVLLARLSASLPLVCPRYGAHHGHRRPHSRGRSGRLHPHPHRRACRAPADQPSTPEACLESPTGLSRTRLGRPGAAATGVRLRPAGTVVAASRRPVAQATGHPLPPSDAASPPGTFPDGRLLPICPHRLALCLCGGLSCAVTVPQTSAAVRLEFLVLQTA
jgi:hypothetical protein